MYASLVNFLSDRGELRTGPFDKSYNREATIDDISDQAVEDFISRAKYERAFPLPENVGKEKLLKHLNLMKDDKVSNAAVLLFGKAPQRFFLSSEVKCTHFSKNGSK